MCVVLQGVTAIACTSDSCRLISGGGEGQVRVWEVSVKGQYMKEALKEHKGAVTCIKIRKNDEEVCACVCIIWLHAVDLSPISSTVCHC